MLNCWSIDVARLYDDGVSDEREIVLDESEELYLVMERPPEEAIPLGLVGDWWVAHTKPRTEKRLAQDLCRLGVTHYLPLRRKQTRSRTSGRVTKSIVPVFSGYLFFNATEEGRQRALTTNRIVTTLRVPAQERFVGELRQIHRVIAAQVEYQLHGQIRTGEWVRVTSGPLIGTEGMVVGKLAGMRLILNVGMLGQAVSVRVDRNSLERLSQPSFQSTH